MILTDELKILDDKIKANQAKEWINMNIWLVKILDINQEYLNKLNLNILHSLIRKEKTDAINKQKEHLKDIKKQKKRTNKKGWKRRTIRRDCVAKRQPKCHTDEFWYEFFWRRKKYSLKSC